MRYPQKILGDHAIGEDQGFLEQVSAMVWPRGLKAEPERDGEVLVRLGNRLVLRFSNDRGRILISVGSLDHSDSFFAIEYIAKLLGWIESDEWLDYQRREDQFVFSSNEDAQPPEPIRSPKEWLDLAVGQCNQMESDLFGENFEARRSDLKEIVDHYLSPASEEVPSEARASHLRY